MKLIKTIISLAVIPVLALAVIFPPAPAAAAGETVKLGVNIGSTDQVVSISGSGFDSTQTLYVNIIFGKFPGTNVDYNSLRYSIVKVEPLNAGTFSTTFTVPEWLENGGFTPEKVTSGNYYVFLTYHTPPATNNTYVLSIASFRVLAGPITMTPARGFSGTQVTVSGYEFVPGEELIVRYDDESVTLLQGGVADASGTFANLKFLIPPSTAGSHAVTVTGKTSGNQAGKVFTVEPHLIIHPDPGTASSKITLAGNGFGSQTNVSVTFNNNSVFSGSTDSSGSFSTVFPPGTVKEGTYTVLATDSAGHTAQLVYNLYDASVVMTPAAGSPGCEVTITGEGFKPGKNITIGFEGLGTGSDIKSSTDSEGVFTSAFTVKWGTIGKWDVTVSDGDNTKTKQFEVNTSGNIFPITNVSNPGRVGTDIAVAGAGFIAGRTVTVNYSGTRVAEGKVQGDGTFNVTFKAPSSSGGNHMIEATDGTNKIPYGFVMESTAPSRPVLVLPESGGRADSEAFFDWEDITDPSGVTYIIEVATDPAFSSTYLVLQEKGLLASEFTVPTQKRLNAVTPEAPYYWRVRAVDLASNEGEWTEPAAFSVGFGMNLPQSVIYIIIVGAALLLAVFTFWLGRKTAYY